VAPWLSYTSIFVLSGAGLLHAKRELTGKFRSRLSLIVTGATWSASAVASYLVARRGSETREFMEGWWESGFLPLLPASTSEWVQWPAAFYRFFLDPMAFTIPVVALVLVFCGCVRLAGRDPDLLVLLVSPFATAMAAAGLSIYPFGGDAPLAGRVILFLAPFGLLLLAEGVEELRSRLKIRPLVAAVGLSALFLVPRIEPGILFTLNRSAPAVARWTQVPPIPPFEFASRWNDPRPVLRGMATLRTDEAIYVYRDAYPPFLYYAPQYGIAGGDIVEGTVVGWDSEGVAREVDFLRTYDRVWLFFAFAYREGCRPFLMHGGRHGEFVHTLQHDRTAGFLFAPSQREGE
jgi:hypothetical protein